MIYVFELDSFFVMRFEIGLTMAQTFLSFKCKEKTLYGDSYKVNFDQSEVLLLEKSQKFYDMARL